MADDEEENLEEDAEGAPPEDDAPDADAPDDSGEGDEDAEVPLDENGEPLIPEEGGGSKKKMIIIIAAVAVLLIGGGAGAYFMGLFGGGGGDTHAEDSHGDGHGGGHGDGHGKSAEDLEYENTHIGVHFLQIPDMVVNLNSPDGKQRYLRLKIQLELNSAEDKAAVERVLPRVVDQFQTYLRELRVKDLRGSTGLRRLQIELLARVNEAAAPTQIKDILFQEILVQ